MNLRVAMAGTGAAMLLAASVMLSACKAPTWWPLPSGSGDDSGLRIIVSSGPVYDVPARDSPPVTPVPQIRGRGTLILEGGGDYVDEASRMTVALAGTNPLLCLIDPVSAKGSSDAYHKFDGIGGFKMLTINLASNSAQQARVIEALESCTGYFINGGDPKMLSLALRPNTQETPALKIIRRRFEQDGAVVAGVGAGAMMAGDLSLCECGPESNVEALVQGNAFEAPGYVFIHGVLIDTHFFARGLLGRHLFVLADTREPVGVGIDEATAVVVPGNGGFWQVIGQSSVALVRRGNASTPKDLQDFTLSVLNAGDSFDPVTGHIAVSPARKPLTLPRNPSAPPVETSKIFDPGKILALIDALAESPSLMAHGYDDGSGMTVQISKRADTTAYGDGNSLTIIDLDLGIVHAAPS